MTYTKQMKYDGCIKTTDERGKKKKIKMASSEPTEIINICLNCDYPKCNGYCDKIRRKKK